MLLLSPIPIYMRIRDSKGVGQRNQGEGKDEVTLFLLEGGHHDQPSWARMLPVFLRRAYATGPSAH